MEVYSEIMAEVQHLPPVANEATPEEETTATGKGGNFSCPLRARATVQTKLRAPSTQTKPNTRELDRSAVSAAKLAIPGVPKGKARWWSLH